MKVVSYEMNKLEYNRKRKIIKESKQLLQLMKKLVNLIKIRVLGNLSLTRTTKLSYKSIGTNNLKKPKKNKRKKDFK